MPNNGNSNYSYSNLAPGFPNDGVSINHGNSYNAHRRPDLSGAPRTFSSQGGRGPILLPLPSNPPIIHPINPPIIPPINLPIIPPINPPINQMQAPIAARSTVPPTGWAPQPGQVSCPQPAAPQQRIAQTPHNTQWIPYEVREPKALTRPRVMTREENDCLVGIFNKHGRHMNAACRKEAKATLLERFGRIKTDVQLAGWAPKERRRQEEERKRRQQSSR